MTDVKFLVPAAQYLRMSTEHQQYSPENQSTGNTQIRRKRRIHSGSDLLRPCKEWTLPQEQARIA